MGWISIGPMADMKLQRELQAKLDEGKQDWELDLERKQGRPDLQNDANFDHARDAEGHR